MRFRLRVDPRDASDELAVVGGTSAAVSQLAVAAPAGVARLARPVAAASGRRVGLRGRRRRTPAPSATGPRRSSPAEELDRLVDAGRGGRTRAGRIGRRRGAAHRRVAPPRSTEVDERTLPHELDWMRTAVHLAKGCYRGQETVAKVHNLGHPPRRLVALHLDGSDSVLPARGDDRPRGRRRRRYGHLGRAFHYEEGPIALAVVRRSTPVDAASHRRHGDGPIAAAQEVIVPPEAGATADVPRLPRLGRRSRERQWASRPATARLVPTGVARRDWTPRRSLLACARLGDRRSCRSSSAATGCLRLRALRPRASCAAPGGAPSRSRASDSSATPAPARPRDGHRDAGRHPRRRAPRCSSLVRDGGSSRIALGMTLVVARFLSSLVQPFAICRGIQSVIVMVMPGQQPFGRLARRRSSAASRRCS